MTEDGCGEGHPDWPHSHPLRPARKVGSVWCPKCGVPVDLMAEPCEVELNDDGTEGRVTDWGPGMAAHCGILIAETDFEGTVEAFRV